MATLTTSGGYYLFECVGYPNRMLNVWGTPGLGVNVTLYQKCYSDKAQQWVAATATGGYVLKSRANQTYVLDPLTAATNKYNAHVYTQSSDSVIAVDNTAATGVVKLRLVNIKDASGNTLYLTAINGNSKPNGGATATSPGNVYWKPNDNSTAQHWGMTFISTNALTADKKLYSSAYYNQQTYPIPSSYCASTLFKGTGCGVCSAAMATNIADIPTRTPENMYTYGLVNIGSTTMKWTQITASQLNVNVLGPTVWASAKEIVFSEIVSGRPVIIYLDNPSYPDRTHFVVGYGLKSGTSAANIDESRVYVLDPWDGATTTLAETKTYKINGAIYWPNVKTVRPLESRIAYV